MCDVRAPQSRSLRRTMSGFAALSLLASACGAGAEAGDASLAESPLADLLGWTDYDPVLDQANELKIQDLTVACMADEGFEYEPEIYDDGYDAEEADAEATLRADPVAYGAKYGYGVVRDYETWEIDQIQSQIDGEPSPGDEYVDPNQDYIESLSESEANVYYETLYGQNQEWEVDDDGNEIQPPPLPPEDRGCMNNARTEVTGPEPWDDPEFSDRMDEFWTESSDDPRLSAANDKWAECMDGTMSEFDLIDGFTVSKPEDMWTYWSVEKAVLTGQWVTTENPDDSDEFDTDFGWGSTELAGGGELSWGGKQHLIEPDQLEGLRTREIETWKEDWDCQKDSGTNDARIEVEQELADSLAKDFPELIAES